MTLYTSCAATGGNHPLDFQKTHNTEYAIITIIVVTNQVP